MSREEQERPTGTLGAPSAPSTQQLAALAGALAGIARQHGFARSAVHAMWESLRRGQGHMAHFDHAEFGGSGQWLRGGMIVVGDIFNDALALRVGALCDELSQLLATHPEWAAEPPRRLSVHWWPAGLSTPASSGAQNGIRYAWFPEQRRLAVERDGEVTLYDTDDHRIGGVAQQQGGAGPLCFSSQHGPIDLATLRRVENSD
jgi:hypothetical protein